MVSWTILIPLILTFSIIEKCHGLSCYCLPMDDPRRCSTQPRTCPPGKNFVDDACNCCKVCSKGYGERCGGLWGMGGTCSYYLTCLDRQTGEPMSSDDGNHNNIATGVCGWAWTQQQQPDPMPQPMPQPVYRPVYRPIYRPGMYWPMYRPRPRPRSGPRSGPRSRGNDD